MQALMYNPMIMQASCTMYSLVDYCKGENESDLRPIVFPVSTPLVSEDCASDVLIAMNSGGKAADLIGLLGSLPGGIGTLVDVTQLLATVEKALNTPEADGDKTETSSTEANGTSCSDQSSILGPPPLMSCKPSARVLRSHAHFAFNHVLASHIQAQLLQRITMPVIDEPVPPEARLPMSSLGGVVSLFDLPLVRPLIAKSSQKTAAGSTTTATADMPHTASKQSSTSSAPVATGDGILGRPPVPRFQGPQKNAAVPVPPSGSSGSVRHSQGPASRPLMPHSQGPASRPLMGHSQAPGSRPLMGRNFAGTSNWPRPRADSRSVVRNQGGEQKQWAGGWKDSGSSTSTAGWQWNNETAGNVYEEQHWNTGPHAIEPDWNSYGGQPNVRPMLSGRNAAKVPQKPSVGQSALPGVRGKPPQVWLMFCLL